MADSDVQTTARLAAQAPASPSQGEPCEECGSPLAADQRYCLECGRRRGGPRVDYRHHMAAAAASDQSPAQPAPPRPSSEEPEKPQRDYAPLAAVGGIAVLGLMLLVGVLIGKGGSNDTASTTPSVIRIPASEGASAPAEASAGSSKGTGGGLEIGGRAKKAKKGGGNGGGTGNAVHASEGDLEELGNTSGEDYVKQSENLPNEIATPGKPPPIDTSKPPGGGEGGAEVIK